MISLSFYLIQKSGFFGTLYSRIQEGGPLQMILILILFLVMFFFIGRAVMKLKAAPHVFTKAISLVNQVALLAVVMGLFSQLIGLIEVVDTFESLDNVKPGTLGNGLKRTLLPPVFGGITFIIGRLASFVLSWIRDSSLDRKDITVE